MATLQKQKQAEKCIIENRNFSASTALSTAANASFRKKGRLLAGGVAFGRLLKIKETERTLEFNVSKEEFDEKFYHYFDLGRDYKKSTKFSPPIRGLKGVGICRRHTYSQSGAF